MERRRHVRRPALGFAAGTSSAACSEEETLLPSTTHVALDRHRAESGLTGLLAVFTMGTWTAVAPMEEWEATALLHTWTMVRSEPVALSDGPRPPLVPRLEHHGALVGATRIAPVV